jgi:hypothetical protein
VSERVYWIGWNDGNGERVEGFMGRGASVAERAFRRKYPGVRSYLVNAKPPTDDAAPNHDLAAERAASLARQRATP